VAIGGKAEQLMEALDELWSEDMTLEAAYGAGVEAFRRAEGREPEGWELAVLEGGNGRRSFRRLDPGEIGTE